MRALILRKLRSSLRAERMVGANTPLVKVMNGKTTESELMIRDVYLAYANIP